MFSSRKTSAPASGALALTKSLRFRSSASAYLTRTTSSTTNQKTWTWSGWLKIGDIASASLLTPFSFGFNPTGATDVGSFFRIYSNQISLSQTTNGSVDYTLTTNQIFRDPSAWYHFVIAFDTTQAVSTNRIKLYVNGSQVTSFGTANYPSQNFNTSANLSGGNPKIGAIDVDQSVTSQFFDGYMSEINFIDGQALTPSSFGATNATTGQWSPATYSGTYGTNGFHLTFTNTTSTTTLGYDTSGNSNNWTTNNISLTAGSTYDSMNDVPVAYSATASNYCVMNPNWNGYGTPTFSNGNLQTVTSTLQTAVGSMALPNASKTYFEATITNNTTQTTSTRIGIRLVSDVSQYGGWVAVGLGAIRLNDTTQQSGLATFTIGDVIGIAVDLTANTLQFYKNGSTYGSSNSIANSSFWVAQTQDNSGSGNTCTVSWNFGQQPFTYTPPSGYNALNTYNLPTPTIVQGNKYMDATLYTGTGASASITNTASFKPDLVWIKSRSAATDHKLTDSVRGVTKGLISDTTGAETTDTQGLTAFNSNGFTLGTDTNYNNTSATYVGWQWQAGAGTSGSNTNGSITSTVSASTTAGFSIVTYTSVNGSSGTVGHGLGVTPAMIIQKRRNATSDWSVQQQAMMASGSTGKLLLNSSAGIATSSTPYMFNATSSVFTDLWADGSTAVAYCFAQIAGFSAFGSYTGNGSATGPFIYTGFQPKYLLVKRTDSTSDWYIWDSVRNTFNIVTNTLLADTAGAETSASSVNILSNGFQCVSSTVVNASGGTYIYAAFASNPFKYSNAF